MDKIMDHDDARQLFRTRLQAIMSKKHLANGQLSKLSGILTGTISRWMAGTVLPDASYRKKLVEALNVSYDELFESIPEEFEKTVRIVDVSEILRGLMIESNTTDRDLIRAGIDPRKLQEWLEGSSKPKKSSLKILSGFFETDALVTDGKHASSAKVVLRLLREHNLSREQLASRLELSLPTVYRWCSGKISVSLENRKLLREMFADPFLFKGVELPVAGQRLKIKTQPEQQKFCVICDEPIPYDLWTDHTYYGNKKTCSKKCLHSMQGSNLASGTSKCFAPYEVARQYLFDQGIRSKRDFVKWCQEGKRPDGIPSNYLHYGKRRPLLVGRPPGKLSEDEVRAIREDLRSDSDVGADYSVTSKTIWNIRTGKTWRHVTD